MENSKEGRRDGRTSLPRSPTSHLHSRSELLQTRSIVISMILRHWSRLTEGQIVSLFRVMLNSDPGMGIWSGLFSSDSVFSDTKIKGKAHGHAGSQMEAVIAAALCATKLYSKDNGFVDKIVRRGLAGKHIFFEYAYKSS